MIDKAPDAYRTISEVAEDIDLPQHVLRFCETRFAQIKPLKRGGGRRYYRPDDVELLKGIRHLLYGEGYTIKGVQRILKDQGPKAVQALVAASAPPFETEAPAPPVPRAPQPVLQPSAPQPPAPAAQHWQAPPVMQAPQHVAPQHVVPQHVAAPSAPQAVLPPQMAPLPPVPVIAPLSPAFPPEPVYAVPPKTEMRAGTPVYMPESEHYLVDDAAASLPVPEHAVDLRPVAPAPATVAFMRGGLAGKPPVDAPLPEAAPAAAQTFSVRRTIRPTPPEPPAQRYMPLVEPELGAAPDAMPQAGALRRPGLTDESRRALQSALFELTECRRSIENTIAGRGR